MQFFFQNQTTNATSAVYYVQFGSVKTLYFNGLNGASLNFQWSFHGQNVWTNYNFNGSDTFSDDGELTLSNVSGIDFRVVLTDATGSTSATVGMSP